MTQTPSNTLPNLTDEERGLLDLANKATSRPWSAFDEKWKYLGRRIVVQCDCPDKPREQELIICEFSKAFNDDSQIQNAAYIANACNIVPTILTTINQLRGELERVRQELDDTAKKLHGAEGMISIASAQIEDLQARINGMPLGTSASTVDAVTWPVVKVSQTGDVK